MDHHENKQHIKSLINFRAKLLTAEIIAGTNFTDEGKVCIAIVTAYLKKQLPSFEWKQLIKNDHRRHPSVVGMIKSGKFLINDVQNLEQIIKNIHRLLPQYQESSKSKVEFVSSA